MHPKSLPFLTAALMSIATSLVQAQVGMASWQAGPLPVTLVYPTAQAIQPRSIGPFTLVVAMNAVPLPERQRLIVLSHGPPAGALQSLLTARHTPRRWSF
jgi:hypothetical protein